MLGRLETRVLGTCLSAYYESLSANTVVEENSTREQIHQDFLKPWKHKFHIQLNLHALDGESRVRSSIVEVAILVFHCYCPFGHANVFVERTSFVRLLCSSSLFDQLNKRHGLMISLLFFVFFFHYTHFFITHSFL